MTRPHVFDAVAISHGASCLLVENIHKNIHRKKEDYSEVRMYSRRQKRKRRGWKSWGGNSSESGV